MAQHKDNHSSTLEPPSKSTELEDAGAHELSSEGEEYFSDASEGQDRSRASRSATPTLPVPTTRVEKVDEVPSHGEVPGTDAYDKRKADAAPDEVEVVPEEDMNDDAAREHQYDIPGSQNKSIPTTVVEMVDSDNSYSEVSSAEAVGKRSADATPDVVVTVSDSDKSSGDTINQSPQTHKSAPNVPQTTVSGAGEISIPSRDLNEGDSASSDKTESTKAEPESDRSLDTSVSMRRRSTLKSITNTSAEGRTPEDSFGDDFDDFEDGAGDTVEDDFGDFDDFEPGQDLADNAPQAQDSEPNFDSPTQAFPLTDLDAMSSLSDLLNATKTHLDAMFPSTTDLDIDSEGGPFTPVTSVFPTERSNSLWKQLITPPPLQPPNWTQSRIRRLFLISLGVPVDLDEVLPPVKQKKLILPDIDLHTSRASISAEAGSVQKLKNLEANDSSASLHSQNSATNTRSRSRPSRNTTKALPMPPPLDVTAVKQLCSTTSHKLDSMEDDELDSHVKELELQTERTSKLLEYWLGRRDELRKEKEAFEGVVENLVKHAKRIRTLK